jgi:hypothetical protein
MQYASSRIWTSFADRLINEKQRGFLTELFDFYWLKKFVPGIGEYIRKLIPEKRRSL